MKSHQLSLGIVEPPASEPTIFEDPDHYPGLTLKQPYAGLVLLAVLGYDGKSIETREHELHYRGPVVVIAGLARDEEADERFDLGWLHDRGIPLDAYQRATSHAGVAVAVVDFAACRDLRPEDRHRACIFKPGLKAWLPSRIRRLSPFPARGLPGFSRVPRGLVEAGLQAADTARPFCPSCGKRDAAADLDADLIDASLMTCATDRFGLGCERTWRTCGCRALRRVAETKPHLVTEVWCERHPEGGVCDCGCDACPFEPPRPPPKAPTFTIAGGQPTIEDLRRMYAEQAARVFYTAVVEQVGKVRAGERPALRVLETLRRRRKKLTDEYFSSARMGLWSDAAWAEHGPDKLWKALCAGMPQLDAIDLAPYAPPLANPAGALTVASTPA